MCCRRHLYHETQNCLCHVTTMVPQKIMAVVKDFPILLGGLTTHKSIMKIGSKNHQTPKITFGKNASKNERMRRMGKGLVDGRNGFMPSSRCSCRGGGVVQEYHHLRFIVMLGWRVFVGQPPVTVVRLSLLL